jgi:hypothetical protein
MKIHPLLPLLADNVRQAGCALTAAISGHGRDGDGRPLETIEEDVRQALKACQRAGHIALAIESDELNQAPKEAHEG